MFSSSAHVCCDGSTVVLRIVGRGGSGSLQEPDLVLPVGRRGVGVSGHDEGVVDADGRTVQRLGQTVDLVDDGQLVSGARERPESHDTGSNHLHSLLMFTVVHLQWRSVLFSFILSTNVIFS